MYAWEGWEKKTFLLSHGFIAYVYCLFRAQAACILVCEYHSIALFSTTVIQHKLTDRIVYLLEASRNKLIIPIGTTQKSPSLCTQTQSRTVAQV